MTSVSPGASDRLGGLELGLRERAEQPAWPGCQDAHTVEPDDDGRGVRRVAVPQRAGRPVQHPEEDAVANLSCGVNR